MNLREFIENERNIVDDEKCIDLNKLHEHGVNYVIVPDLKEMYEEQSYNSYLIISLDDGLYSIRCNYTVGIYYPVVDMYDYCFDESLEPVNKDEFTEYMNNDLQYYLNKIYSL